MEKSYLQLALEKVKELGYRVFVTSDNPTYAFYTDGTNIGYIQKDFAGLYISTVNKPPFSDNSGFIVSSDKKCDKTIFTIEELTNELLNLAFADFPIWLTKREQKKHKIVKYKDINDFLNNYWNKEKLMEL